MTKKRKNYSKPPKEYVVDLSRTTYRGEYVPNIKEEVHEAFSPEQALGYVLKRNCLSFLYDKLEPEIDRLVKEKRHEPARPKIELSEPEPKRKPEWQQGELFDLYDDF